MGDDELSGIIDPDLPDRTWRGREIYQQDLAELAAGTFVREWIFEQCHFKGPMIFLLAGAGSFVEYARVYLHPEWSPDAVLYEISDERAQNGLVGMIGLESCILDRCQFSGVGFAGTPEKLAAVREAIIPYH
jgi:hypothetical protein